MAKMSSTSAAAKAAASSESPLVLFMAGLMIDHSQQLRRSKSCSIVTDNAGSVPRTRCLSSSASSVTDGYCSDGSDCSSFKKRYQSGGIGMSRWDAGAQSKNSSSCFMPKAPRRSTTTGTTTARMA